MMNGKITSHLKSPLEACLQPECMYSQTQFSAQAQTSASKIKGYESDIKVAVEESVTKSPCANSSDEKKHGRCRWQCKNSLKVDLG